MATLSGRYYAMDRDKRWDRVEKAYDAMVDASGAARFDDVFAALDASYADNVTDEFVVPAVLGDYAGMADGDALLFANFRADRAREISLALLDEGFQGFRAQPGGEFQRRRRADGIFRRTATMMAAVFPPEDVRETLGEVMAEHHLKQLRIAETEKYAHVTFFLNGGREEPFAGEDRILVPSPKVSTYDHKPEMSAYQVTDKLVEAIGSGKYDLIVANYANPDMVGHTGVMAAAIKAVDTIDECLGRLRAAIEKAGGVMLLTADHGNIEMMKDPVTGEPHTAHTTFDVPIVAIGAPKGSALENGRLADVAPTMLALMGLKQPAPMTGHSLSGKARDCAARFLSSAGGGGTCTAAGCLAAPRPNATSKVTVKSGAASAPGAERAMPSPRPNRRSTFPRRCRARRWTSFRPARAQLGTLNAETGQDKPALASAKAEKRPAFARSARACGRS